MSIVSSTHTLGPLQADGRRYVDEAHTDGNGDTYQRSYGPVAADADYVAIRTAYAARLAIDLAEAEADLMIGW